MNRVAEYREKAGISQDKLCKKIKVSLAHLQRVENNEVRAPLKLLARVSKELDCGVGDLIG